MKKLNLTIIGVMLVLMPVVLVGCVKPTPKTFSADGISITVDSSFTKKDYMTFNFYLESKDKIVTALKEEPASGFPITKSLSEYTALVLQANNLTSATVNTYDENGVVFDYFKYEKTNAGKNFTYLAITKKATAFYLFNFACETKNYSGFEAQFMEWAKLIVVE